MADEPSVGLAFSEEACPDCGERHADLPPPLPPVPDDIDLRARDYDRLRRVMLEDLAARRPDRKRWTPADLDVVLVEAFASALDELSDMADRAAAEAYLESARHPVSVRWHLEMLGMDPVREAFAAGDLGITEEDLHGLSEEEKKATAALHLDRLWLQEPALMEKAREAGPRSLRLQRRMVTVSDYAERLEDHPLVHRATAWSSWSGTWPLVHIAAITVANRPLDENHPTLGDVLGPAIKETVNAFHTDWDLSTPSWHEPDLTLRVVLRPYVDALRMIGYETTLRDAEQVPITVALSIDIDPSYYRSEIRGALQSELGSGPGGRFEPDRYDFGQDVFASDIVERALSVDGVEAVCVNRLKRRGTRYPDRAGEGVIVLRALEVPVLGPGDSGLRLTLRGGKAG